MQRGVVVMGASSICIELPDESVEVLPGVKWGRIDAFPSPAYWKYQVLARRVQGDHIRYRLGRTLTEEVGACLLGGHGIPASVGLAAFEHLKGKGAFGGSVPAETELYAWLSEPLSHGGRYVRYRFARQKAKYLHAALAKLKKDSPPTQSGRALRDWLTSISGIGLKTASWVARNWLDANDVAILDIHVLRAGQLGRFMSADLTVERHYLGLEAEFLRFAEGLEVKAAELDAVIWHEMMSSPLTVHRVLNGQQRPASARPRRRASGTENRGTNADQLPLLV